ncbi:MAG: phosphatidate cytidylyltransferase [Vampirovibrionales bacterium]|nr:phosphatidate cytidylyltransferase [Vampirovibrionales bacterium]
MASEHIAPAWRSLKSRLIVGFSLFGVFLAALWLGGLAWAFLMAFASFLAARELVLMMHQARLARPLLPVLIVFGMALMLAGLRGKTSWFMPTLTLAVVGTFLGVLLRGLAMPKTKLPQSGALADIGATLVVLFYLAFLPAHYLLLRLLGGQSLGLGYVLFTALVVMASDIGAYAFGKWLGRTPLLSAISPKKTREGALGGLFFALLVGLTAGPACGIKTTHVLILGSLLVLAAQLGDLVESMMKRDAGVKDTGVLLKAHGGVLDRIDSWLFAAPLAYYYIEWVVLRQGWLWNEAIPFLQKQF